MNLRSWATDPVAGARSRGAVATFACAVAFRVALFFSGLVDVAYETGDSPEYRGLADSLLHFGVFGLDGVPKMNRTPGYPAWLAGLFATVGSSQLAVTGAQVALDALTCAMAYDLAARARLSRLGRAVTAALAITCLFTSALSFQMMTETLSSFLAVSAVWVLPSGRLTRLLSRAPRWRLGASGLLLGAATLVRPNYAVTLPAFAALALLVLARRLGRRAVSWSLVTAGVVLGAAASAVVVPWMLRNRTVFHAEYDKPDHSHVTLLGYKTDVPVYRHWYSEGFQIFRRSYEEPFVMETPYGAPSIARYVYPGEREEVREAFAQLGAEIRASETEAITAGTLARFRRIGEARYTAAPRLHLTAPLSRMVKLWISPRVSLLLARSHGGNVPLRTAVASTLYDVLYVIPGMIGLALAWPRASSHRLAIVATVVAQTLFYALWHASPHSRYMVPLFPLVSVGCGVCAMAAFRRLLRS